MKKMDINFLRFAFAIMASASVSAGITVEPSPFTPDVKGNIVEDHSQKSIDQVAAFSPMKMIPPSEKRGDWFNMSANFTQTLRVWVFNMCKESMLPPLKPQPVIVAVLDSVLILSMRI